MTISAEQTLKWVASKISGFDEVSEALPVGANTLQVTRKKLSPFFAGVISFPVVTTKAVQMLLRTDSRIEIIANIPKESVWTGDAIAMASEQAVAFGGLSDLMSAASYHDPVRGYRRREYEFVERGLEQHDRVLGIEREFDRVYLVHRYDLPSLRFVMLNE